MTYKPTKQEVLEFLNTRAFESSLGNPLNSAKYQTAIDMIEGDVTLSDYYAGHALAMFTEALGEGFHRIAFLAFEMSDAMMKERAKRE